MGKGDYWCGGRCKGERPKRGLCRQFALRTVTLVRSPLPADVPSGKAARETRRPYMRTRTLAAGCSLLDPASCSLLKFATAPAARQPPSHATLTRDTADRGGRVSSERRRGWVYGCREGGGRAWAALGVLCLSAVPPTTGRSLIADAYATRVLPPTTALTIASTAKQIALRPVRALMHGRRIVGTVGIKLSA